MNIRTELKNGMTIDEVCRKYRISFIDLINTLKYNKTTVDYQHIFKNGSRYIIQKSIDGKSKVYGSYFQLEDALDVRDQLIKLDWKVDEKEYLGDMYITKTLKGDFRVAKNFGKCKTIVYGIYEKLDDARRVRDCLVRMDWDKDYLPLILKRLGVVRVGC